MGSSSSAPLAASASSGAVFRSAQVGLRERAPAANDLAAGEPLGQLALHAPAMHTAEDAEQAVDEAGQSAEERVRRAAQAQRQDDRQATDAGPDQGAPGLLAREVALERVELELVRLTQRVSVQGVQDRAQRRETDAVDDEA